MSLHNFLFGTRTKTIKDIIEEGNIDEIENFIRSLGDVNSVIDDESLLNFAIDNCGSNYFNVIELLINNGADIKCNKSYLKETPLHRICARNKPNIEVAKLLLERGAEVNAQNISGKTPIFYCNFSFSVELLNLLLKYGADINHTDKYKNTLLHDDYLNCNTETFEEFLKILISCGFNINSKNNVGDTPLYLCKNKFIENVLMKYQNESE